MLKVRLLKDYNGYKANNVVSMLESKYYELKKLGIVNLIAGNPYQSDTWLILEEEEE